MQVWLSAARTSVALLFLVYSSWRDYQSREVSNKVWIFFAPLAFIITFLEIYIFDSPMLLFYGVCVGLTSAFALIIFYTGGFGGADAKALMCLALALPFYPQPLLTPFSGEPSLIAQLAFPITVFTNAVLFAAGTAAYLFLYNIVSHKAYKKTLFEGEHATVSIAKRTLVLLTGYKMPIEKLKEKWHIYPLEDVEQNSQGTVKRKLLLMPKDEGRNEIVNRLSHAAEKGVIQNKVWATPGLPMLIFITAGLVVALVFGDVVWLFVKWILA
ncbi:prepilin peptidase [Candidatus Bathyarchaeota archaeon]|nr:prepilin peptidase [Candidatus Bathyarchaeota archaeon]